MFWVMTATRTSAATGRSVRAAADDGAATSAPATSEAVSRPGASKRRVRTARVWRLRLNDGTVELDQSSAGSAKASGGGQEQTRWRSPYAWSIRATGGQYLSGSGPVGKTPTSRA